MGKRQRDWAQRTRDKIFAKLGRRCNACGSMEELEFDVIQPEADQDGDGKHKHHRQMDWSWRMSFYRKQLARDNLQVLCSKCNSKKRNDPF